MFGDRNNIQIFFVNVTLASTFVNVTLAWLELNLCHLKKREDRIFSNYSDFQRLRNKSRESKKGNIDIFLKKIIFRFVAFSFDTVQVKAISLNRVFVIRSRLAIVYLLCASLKFSRPEKFSPLKTYA